MVAVLEGVVLSLEVVGIDFVVAHSWFYSHCSGELRVQGSLTCRSSPRVYCGIWVARVEGGGLVCRLPWGVGWNVLGLLDGLQCARACPVLRCPSFLPCLTVGINSVDDGSGSRSPQVKALAKEAADAAGTPLS
jgi:hypothetical protein